MKMPVSRKLNSNDDKPIIKSKPIKKPITRRTKPKEIISRTGIVLTECYCRRCMKTKTPDLFYEAVDGGLLDKNGKMSICRDCCNEVYNNFYNENHSVEKSLLKACRTLNIRYDEGAVQATNDTLFKYLERDKETEKTFGVYKSKLMKLQNTRITDRNVNEDFTFVEPSVRIINDELDDNIEDSAYLKQMWGTNLEYNDYVWLENELSEWKRTHKCDTKAEETLLKEICFKGLEIKKARESNGTASSSMIKDYQDLMKTANVDPSKTSVAGSGRSQDTFSAFIKTIEQTEPAEYFENKKLFKDFDNIDFYFKKYITRPLKNFITQSRDFNVDADSDPDEFEDFDINQVLDDGDAK
jgi:hypothetical protein